MNLKADCSRDLCRCVSHAVPRSVWNGLFRGLSAGVVFCGMPTAKNSLAQEYCREQFPQKTFRRHIRECCCAHHSVAIAPGTDIMPGSRTASHCGLTLCRACGTRVASRSGQNDLSSHAHNSSDLWDKRFPLPSRSALRHSHIFGESSKHG